jgi:hypothetical protein
VARSFKYTLGKKPGGAEPCSESEKEGFLGALVAQRQEVIDNSVETFAGACVGFFVGITDRGLV